MPAPYETVSFCNTIYVVESLPDGELKSGQELHDDTLRRGVAPYPGMLAAFHSVKTAAEFMGVLRGIEQGGRRR